MALPAGAGLQESERMFGKYELISKLATGGMAEIFLARRINDPDQSTLVIKRVLPHLEEEERFVDMFRDEARLASQIEHLNVCKVFEAGVTNNRNFIAMEFLSGIPLSNILTKVARERSTMGFRIVASILTQACAGLHAAHELKGANGELVHLVHRDMTPSNIFITNEGIVKVLDFGVAKAHGASQKTRTGTLKGKNAYMSPEQILTSNLDRRSDLFSLGVVFWESLTAKRLFSRHSDFLTFRAITEEEVPRVDKFRNDCPPSIVKIVEKALAKDPKDRFTTALELKASIAEAMVNLGGVATKEELKVYLERNFPTELEETRDLFGTVSTMASMSSASLKLPLQAPAESSNVVDFLEELDEDDLIESQPELDSMQFVPDAGMASEEFDFDKTTTSGRYDTTQGLVVGKRRNLFVAGLVGLVALLAVGWFGFKRLGGDGVVSAESIKDSLAAPKDPSTGHVDPFAGNVVDKNSEKRKPTTEATEAKEKQQEDVVKKTQEKYVVQEPLVKKLQPKQNPKTNVTTKITKATKNPSSRNKTNKTRQEKEESKANAKIKSAEKPEIKKPVKKGPGFYSIDTVPYSIIYVDGKRMGETPLFKIKIPSGAHRIKAVSADGKSKSWKVNIVEGRHVNRGSVLLK